MHPEFPLSKGLSLRENISASEEAGQLWRERIALELDLQSNLIHFITLSPLRKFSSLNIKQQEKGAQGETIWAPDPPPLFAHGRAGAAQRNSKGLEPIWIQKKLQRISKQ